MAFAFVMAFVTAATHAPRAFADKEFDDELLSSCGHDSLDRAAELLQKGANANAANEYGVAALHLAASNGNVELIKLLIKNGAKVAAKTSTGETAIVSAAQSDHLGAVKALLDAGATPTPEALGQASRLGHKDVVIVLLNAGAAPDAGLEGAAQGGQVEIAQLLLDKGAHVNRKGKNGFTALHLASLQGGPTTVRLLLSKGADPNAVNDGNETPLHCAVGGDRNIEVVKLLLAAGAKTNIADKQGMTPVRLASVQSSREIYNALLQASGGKEPTPVRSKSPQTTKQLIDDLASKKPAVREAAQRELAGRGKEIMPEVLQSIDAGVAINRFYELFQVMGPNAELAIPKIEIQLGDKEQVYIAAITIERMKPGAIAQLNDKTKQQAAEALYEAILDPKTDVAVGVHTRLLIHLGDPAVPTILRLLRSDRPEVRAFVARQFENAPTRNEAILAELLKLQGDEKSMEVKAGAVRGLGNPSFRSPDAKAALIERLRTPPITNEYDPSAPDREREAAVAKKRAVDNMLNELTRTLAAYGPEMVDELLPLIRTGGDPAWEQYKKVWDGLGPDSVPKFQGLLDDSDERVRRVAYQELGRLAMQSPNALDTLATRLESSKPDERQQAADALWAIAGVSPQLIQPKLLARLGDDEIKIGTRCRLVLAALRLDRKQTKASDEVRQFLPQIIETAKKGEYIDRCVALETLGTLGVAAKDAVPDLQVIAEQKSPPRSGRIPFNSKDRTPVQNKELREQAESQAIKRAARAAMMFIEKDLKENGAS